MYMHMLRMYNMILYNSIQILPVFPPTGHFSYAVLQTPNFNLHPRAHSLPATETLTNHCEHGLIPVTLFHTHDIIWYHISMHWCYRNWNKSLCVQINVSIQSQPIIFLTLQYLLSLSIVTVIKLTDYKKKFWIDYQLFQCALALSTWPLF